MTAPAFANPSLALSVPLTASPVARMLVTAGQTLAVWETRARTRADLRGMCVSRYGDVGLTTAEVLREVSKPFWRG